jgi:hypothetical protein
LNEFKTERQKDMRSDQKNNQRPAPEDIAYLLKKRFYGLHKVS